MRAELLENPAKRAGAPGHRFTGELRNEWRRLGARDVAGLEPLIARGVRPIAGGATGMDGAAFMHNLPPEGSYVMDSDLFFANTERNDVPQAQVTYPGLGGAPVDQRISNVGVLAGIRLIFEGTLKTVKGTGTVTATHQWPHNVIKSFSLSANGQTSLLSCEGLDMRARRQRVYRNPRDPLTSAPSADGFGDPENKEIADGEYAVTLSWDVPIIHDWYTLTGALFAQSDQIYLSWHATMPAAAELFTLTGTATATLTGNIKWTSTFFDVPFANTGNGRKVLVPDLQWLHGFVSNDFQFANQGEVQAPLIRTSGELLAYYGLLRNGTAGTIAPTSLTRLAFEYGGNRKPRVHEPVSTLLTKNVEDYNGQVLPKAGYFIFDFEADNPSRDLVFPKGVTELKVTPTIPTTVEVKSNAALHFVEEALFAGR